MPSQIFAETKSFSSFFLPFDGLRYHRKNMKKGKMICCWRRRVVLDAGKIIIMDCSRLRVNLVFVCARHAMTIAVLFEFTRKWCNLHRQLPHMNLRPRLIHVEDNEIISVTDFQQLINTQYQLQANWFPIIVPIGVPHEYWQLTRVVCPVRSSCALHQRCPIAI